MNPYKPLQTTSALSGDTVVPSFAMVLLVVSWFIQIWEETPRVGRLITAFKNKTEASKATLAFIIARFEELSEVV